MPAEHSFWLNSSANAPFGCHHEAEGQADKKCAFVFCGPFAEEKNKSQRLFVDLARAFAGAGVGVLRLDYGGTGDSQGSFDQATIASRKADILAAIEYCRNERGAARIGLLGLRLGAALAAEVAEEAGSISWLILLSPVADVPHYIQTNLRSKLVKELLTDGKVSSRRQDILSHLDSEPIDFDGFPITPAFYNEAKTFTWTDRLGKFRGPTLVICASLKPAISKDAALVETKYREIGADVTVTKALCEPFWSVNTVPPFDKIIDAATQWLRDRVSDNRRDAASETARKPAVSGKAELTRVTTAAGHEEVMNIALPDGFLTGVVHVPADWQSNPSVAIVMIHGWAGYRIGPHKMLINAARRFCHAGYLCLRINVRGRGDSSGRSDDTSISTNLQDGQAAADEVKERFHPARLVALGQCMGGSAAIGVEGADGCISWSAPPIDQSARAKTRKTWFMIGAYLGKIADMNTWRKILRLQLNFPLIREALFGHFRRGAAGSEFAAKQVSARVRAASASAGPCLFIYGGNDPDASGARATYKEACNRAGRPSEFHVVEGANHSFYSMAWEKEVLDKTMDWLKQHFPAKKDENHGLH